MIRLAPNGRTYLFIHVPKTGGTSIANALDLPNVMHVSAVQERRDAGDEAWNSAFKFAFVRNPWDRIVSQYHYRLGKDETGIRTTGISFDEWVRLAYGFRDPKWCWRPEFFGQQRDWIQSEHGKIELDFVGRFETFESDCAFVATRLGILKPTPHLNRTEHRPYQEYYTGGTEQIIRRCFKDDIALFGYEF